MAIVVVPVYKSTPDPDDAFSWRRCLDVFPTTPVAIVAPEGLDLAAYVRPADERARPIDVVRFDPAFFLSTGHSSRLLLSTGFYEPLRSYEFILVHQLDALVFRDELADWCRRGYDYVGAPWIEMEWVAEARPRWSPQTRDVVVGNGGFALRRVAAAWTILTEHQEVADKWGGNEHMFWSFLAGARRPFSIPSLAEAVGFSFETRRRGPPSSTGGACRSAATSGGEAARTTSGFPR